MTIDKSSSPDHHDDVEGSATRSEHGGSTSSTDAGNVSDDLNRIASYLTEKQAGQSTRNLDLAEEIAHRRPETSGHANHHANFPGNRLGDVAHDDDADEAPIGRALAPRGTVDPMPPNPILAERLDAFCRELDEMLERFRAQVEYRSSVKH